jgi:TonB-linked SusC/RagA family outer membrane protein
MTKVVDYFVSGCIMCHKSATVLLLSLLLLCSPVVFGLTVVPVDQRRIEGVVLDDRSNELLSGVSISLSDSRGVGVVTDAVGRFVLSVGSLPVTLSIQYVGYKPLELEVYEYSEPLVVSLREDLNYLTEVVVVGYGTQQRKALTGAITTVSKESLQQLSTSFDNLLGGAVSGLNVTQSSGQPGASYNIRIRGGNSINGGNEPLYVIDGVIIYEDNNASSTSADVTRIADRLNPLASINPGDIESIEILKDVSATAIYGSRGSNGVIIITTKSGKKGRNNIDYQYNVGWQRVSRTLSLLNARQWAELNREIDPNSSITDAELASAGEGVDWQGAALRTAPTQTHQLTISGGDERTRYLVSGNYTDQSGIILNTDFRRYSGRFNFERDLFTNLTVGTSVSASKLNQNGLASYGGLEVNGASNALDYLLGIPQLVPIYNADGTFNYNNRFEIGDLRYGDRTVNALSDLVNTVAQNISNNLLGTFFASWSVIPSLTARVSVGTNLTNATQNFFGPSSSAAGFLTKGYGSVGNIRTDSWQYEYTLNYARQLSRLHHISLLGGYSTQTTSIERTTAISTNFANEQLTYHNLQAGSGFVSPRTAASEALLNSVLGRANYTLLDRYNLTATLRADGSSRFASEHKWGYFPSLGVSWNIDEESFIRGTKWLSDLKLRASAGTVGNQEIGNYKYESTYVPEKYSFNNRIVVAYRRSNRANPDLKWEQTTSYNLGLDAGFFHDRLTLIADAYYKETSDLLLSVPLETTTGYTSMLKNVGAVRNRGLEFELRATLLDSKSLTWSFSANIAKNINEVTNVALESGYIIQGSTIIKEGESLGSFYGFEFDGIVQTSDDISKLSIPSRKPDIEPGDIKYKNQNPQKDNTVTQDDDQVVLGSIQPDYTYGFSSSLRYRSFGLFASFQGSVGNELYNALRMRLESPDVSYNGTTTLLDRWTVTHPSGTVPKATLVPASWLDSRYIEDASYLRLKNITLSYDLPLKIERVPGIRLKVFITAQNLLTFTKYAGYDPEVASGTDSGAYPTSKTFSLGVNISY